MKEEPVNHVALADNDGEDEDIGRHRQNNMRDELALADDGENDQEEEDDEDDGNGSEENF